MNYYKVDLKRSFKNFSRNQKRILWIGPAILLMEIIVLLFDQTWNFWLWALLFTFIALLVAFSKSGKKYVFEIVHHREMESYVLQKSTKSALEKIFLAPSPFTRQYRFKQVTMIREFRENGSLLSETPYKNGRINGERKIFSPSGKLRRSTMYIEDEQSGWDKKLDLGQVSIEQHFKNARLHGICKEYDQFNGNLVKELCYDNDQLHGVSKFYNSSDQYLEKEVTYNRGTKEGITKLYYPDGTLQEEAEYANDMRNGVTKTFYTTGNIKAETTYNNNKKHGLEKIYYEDGGILSETIFHENKETEDKKYFDPDGNVIDTL